MEIFSHPGGPDVIYLARNLPKFRQKSKFSRYLLLKLTYIWHINSQIHDPLPVFGREIAELDTYFYISPAKKKKKKKKNDGKNVFPVINIKHKCTIEER